MWLKQKVYTFRITKEDSVREDSIGHINVKLNGNLTTIKLTQLFAKISKSEFSEDGHTLAIKGWSILQDVKSNKLKIDENEIEISFESENLGSLSIESIENPWWILNDIELSDSDVAEINGKILQLSGLDKPSEEIIGETESPHTPPPVIINQIYEKGKINYQKIGYTEYSKDNFRFLINDKSGKVLLIELKDEKDLIQYRNSSKVIDNFYKFEDDTNNRIIDVKIIGEDLDISFSEKEEPDYENEELKEKNSEYKEESSNNNDVLTNN